MDYHTENPQSKKRERWRDIRQDEEQEGKKTVDLTKKRNYVADILVTN